MCGHFVASAPFSEKSDTKSIGQRPFVRDDTFFWPEAGERVRHIWKCILHRLRKSEYRLFFRLERSGVSSKVCSLNRLFFRLLRGRGFLKSDAKSIGHRLKIARRHKYWPGPL